MPPARTQGQNHPTHQKPYPRDRAGSAMASTSRQSSSGSGVASKSQSQPPAVKLEQSSEEIIRPRPDQETEGDARRESRKKKRRTKNRVAEDEAVSMVKQEEDTKPLKLQTHARPLATSTGTNNATPSIKPSSLNVTTGNTNPKPSTAAPSKSEARLLKLEQRSERYKAKLKEAEARAVKDEEKAKEDAEKIKELEAKLKEQESSLQVKEEEAKGVQQVVDDHLKAIEGHVADRDHVKETLQEAVSCLICSDTLHDPHILSCGHIACRDCLKSWFRQPNAYQSDVGRPIQADRDMSYRSKVCHVCRSIVLRRPTRMYNLYSFLEPLGIISGQQIPIPTASQTPANADPWALSFPPERTSYRLHDVSDDIERCPSCLFEICENVCEHCQAEFSGDDNDDSLGDFTDDELLEQDLGDTDDGGNEAGDGAGGGRVRARRVGGGARRARVDIATIEEVLGDGQSDEEPYDIVRGQVRRAEARIRSLRDRIVYGDQPREALFEQLNDAISDRREGRQIAAETNPDPNGSDGDESVDTDGSTASDRDFRARLATRDEQRRTGQIPNRYVPGRRRGRLAIDDENESDSDSDNHENEAQTARMRARGVRRARAALVDDEAIDEDDTHSGSGSDSDLSELGSASARSGMFDSEEDDGGLPRTRTFARGRLALATDEEDEELTEEGSYEGSFIDDEGDGLTASTQEDEVQRPGEEDESDEVMAEETIGRARRRQNTDEDEDISQEEGPVNMQELRRRRLEALANSRRNAGSARLRRNQVDSEIDELLTDSDA